MKKLEGKLPLIAFVVAAFAAVAFTSPKSENPMYGYDGANWYLVDENTPPGSYQCDSQNEPGCLFDAVGGNPIDDLDDRIFVNISLTPIGL